MKKILWFIEQLIKGFAEFIYGIMMIIVGILLLRYIPKETIKILEIL